MQLEVRFKDGSHPGERKRLYVSAWWCGFKKAKEKPDGTVVFVPRPIGPDKRMLVSVIQVRLSRSSACAGWNLITADC